MPSIDERLEKMEKLLEAHAAPREDTVEKAVDKSAKYMKWVHTAITLAAILIATGVTWGLTQGKVSTLEAQVGVLNTTVSAERTSSKEEIDKLKNKIIEIQVKQAAADQVLTDIREDVAEIKDDVKKLTRGR